ncbi:hypothetical protein JRO89_XS03G0194700 [Xanthoceras sorbifolium]|uniref:Uncharacterized protein n=1 Tax=Xanthoceras sorbifolium TaxID=99658 RepID=A0ABQ8IAM0_9ROSI|nr:hypothetical protein JRO89_XS03G0194700 [Xanthoceras sorbifolium]
MWKIPLEAEELAIIEVSQENSISLKSMVLTGGFEAINVKFLINMRQRGSRRLELLGNMVYVLSLAMLFLVLLLLAP